MVRAIVGANWGDEGKGKITDVLAAESDVVIRFQGGSNAGHTIINQYGKFALHQLPSGVFYDHITNIIGNGVALDIGKFLREAAALKEKGVKPRLMVSDRTQVVMPYHVLFDQYEEERLGGKSSAPPNRGSPPSIRTNTPRRASSCASCSTRTTPTTSCGAFWPSRTCCWRSCIISRPSTWIRCSPS